MFVNSKIDTKLKLAILWTTLMFLYVYADFFDGMTPSSIEMSKNLETPIGPLTPLLLILFSIILIVPTLMIILSIFLRPRINRVVNIIIATLWASMSVVLFFDTFNSEWHLFYALFQFIELTIFIIIIWQAYKWPKQSEI